MSAGAAVRALRVARLAGIFLAGQGIVRATQFAFGFALVWLLPVEEYALYTAASALLAWMSLGSNFGISQAVLTRGARLTHDRTVLGTLFRTAAGMCRWLFAALAPAGLLLAWLMLAGYETPITGKIVIVALIFLNVWLFIGVSLRRSILSIFHDARGLFTSGMAEGLARLGLLPLVALWPQALLVMGVNLAGMMAGSVAIRRRTAPLMSADASADPAHRAAIRSFVVPLVPSVAYTAMQGHLSIFLLSLFGYTAAVAEVGALGRLGQLVALVAMLNPFLVQPLFGRLGSFGAFRKLVGLMLALLIAGSAAIVAAAYAAPRAWLFLLGAHYGHLERELPLALAAAAATVVGATLYTILISRSVTRGQTWIVAPSLLGQAAFIAAHGVSSTYDALLLNLIHPLAHVSVQALLLLRMLRAGRLPSDGACASTS